MFLPVPLIAQEFRKHPRIPQRLGLFTADPVLIHFVNCFPQVRGPKMRLNRFQVFQRRSLTTFLGRFRRVLGFPLGLLEPGIDGLFFLADANA